MSASIPVVAIERLDDILILTLDRPEARNAVNREVAEALAAGFAELDRDDALRVGILTGRGPAFSAGQDLKALAAGEDSNLPDLGWAGLVKRPPRKPLIAAVNGFAYGGGMELALACDLVVASETASFALPEVRRGLFAAAGGVPRALQQLPAKVGMRLVLTGEPMTAAEAARWGLVTDLVAPERLRDAAIALARTIAANAPLSVQASKLLATETAFASTGDASTWAAIDRELARVFASADAREGAVAFTEKRPPVWSGR